MQKDYIMRLIAQFVQAILSIVRLRKEGEYKEARQQVQITARYLLRADLDLVLLYNNDQVLDHFRDLSGRFETEKCVLGADLFYELALIEEAEQQHAAELRLKLLCLHLYITAIPKEQQFQKHQYFEKVDELIEELKNQTLPENLLISLLSYKQFTAQMNRNLNEQPIARILVENKLTNSDLISASTENITYKMLARACKGRRLTPHIQLKICNALNKASGKAFTVKDLFNY